MTEETRVPSEVPADDSAIMREVIPGPAARRNRSATPGRIAATGIGIAAMLGLAANMEVAGGRTPEATPTPAPASATAIERTVKADRPGSVTPPGEIASAKVNRPIVLTPRAVVHSVSAPAQSGTSVSGAGWSGGGSSGGSAAAAPAPAPAAAPVVNTSGSR